MSKIKFCSVGECMLEIANINKNKYIQSFAGDTLNFASYLNKKLIDVDYLTSVGISEINKIFFKLLRQKNISKKLVHIHAIKETGLYLINNNSLGEKKFYYWRDDSAAKNYFNSLNFMDLKNILLKYNYLYFSGITLSIISLRKQKEFLQLIKKLKKNNVKIIFDLNIRLKRWSNLNYLSISLNLFLPFVDILFATGEDMKNWQNKDGLNNFINLIKKSNINHAIFRKSASINYALYEGEVCKKINIVRKKIIDSSGAGDGYNAAYISSFLDKGNIVESLKAAHAMGFEITMKKGAII